VTPPTLHRGSAHHGRLRTFADLVIAGETIVEAALHAARIRR
jgi:hypothetical protein